MLSQLETLIRKVELKNDCELSTNQISCLEIGMEEGFRSTDHLIDDLDLTITRLESEVLLLKSLKFN